MLRRIAIGCTIIVVLIVLCPTTMAVALYVSSSRLSPPLPDAPVSVDGDCPIDAVMAYGAGGPAQRIERILAPLDAMSGDGDFNDAATRLQGVDVAAMRAERDALVAQSVPACVEELRAAEVDLADLVIDVVDDVQGATRNGMSVRGYWASLRGIVAMVRGVEPRLSRVKAGWEALGVRLGVDFESLDAQNR